MASVTGGGALDTVLTRIGTSLDKAREVRVGFLEGATYPDGTPVAMVAAIQNFGAPAAGIPPRPFFSDMVERHKGDWGDTFGNVLMDADYNAGRALALMGKGMAGQLREQIVETNAPPLSPRTIAAKGSEKPLIDTGHMLESVDKEVV
jgi:hypothetical protein